VTYSRKRRNLTHFQDPIIYIQLCVIGTQVMPAALASCTFQITVQHPVSYVQSTEWNSATVSKRSDSKICTSENVPIRVLFTFDGTKKPHSNVRTEILQNISSQAVERVVKTTLNSQQVKTYFVRFLKPIYLNWRIYNIKPVYYV